MQYISRITAVFLITWEAELKFIIIILKADKIWKIFKISTNLILSMNIILSNCHIALKINIS